VRQAERPKNVDPVLTVREIEKRREEFVYFATPIFNKPKPKPKVETPPAGTQTPKEGQPEANGETQEGQSEANGNGESKRDPPEMDVD
jgi:heat shock protein 4